MRCIFELKAWLKKGRYYFQLRAVWRSVLALVEAGKTIAGQCRRLWLYARRRAIIKAYLRRQGLRKLQIGCGANPFPGWLNTDFFPRVGTIAFLDATEPMPFPNNTFDYIFFEHMIEHVPYRDGMNIFRESFRVLKPGGRVRISTPNLQVYLDLFRQGRDAGQQKYVEWTENKWLGRAEIDSRQPACILNLVMHGWGHAFVYDLATLKESLGQAGLEDIRQYECGKSDDENLRGRERHGEFIGNEEMNAYETLVVEAVKPLSPGASR